MRQYIEVSYSQKDKAKRAGANWDPQAKSWYWNGSLDNMPKTLWAYASEEQRETRKDKQKKIYDRHHIMCRAWIIARIAAFNFGGSAREYMSGALKQAWEEARN